MIEFVSFGNGYRKDGHDWGEQELPYSETGWRQLEVGSHVLEQATTGWYLTQNLVYVFSDGRGQLTTEASPQSRALLGTLHPVVVEGLVRPNVRLDESRGFMPIMNVLFSDLLKHPDILNPGANLETIARQVTRLTGAVRYNP